MKIIIYIVIAVVVIGGGYAALSNKKATDTNVAINESVETGSEATTTPDTAESASSTKKMAFSEFIKKGGSYRCTVNQSVGGIDSKGTTYIDGSMIRGEYNTQVQGLSIDTTLIVRDGYTYSWSSAAPTMGFKAKIVEGTSADGTTKTSDTYSFNAEQIGDYDCQPWTADASKFAIPTSVTFKTI